MGIPILGGRELRQQKKEGGSLSYLTCCIIAVVWGHRSHWLILDHLILSLATLT